MTDEKQTDAEGRPFERPVMHHTPGPWTCSEPNGKGMGWRAGPAWVGQEAWLPVCGANARLIAAAPDLLMALQMLYAETADYIRLNNLGGMDNQCMRLARCAIAKAAGDA